jgi:hypothetical protein
MPHTTGPSSIHKGANGPAETVTIFIGRMDRMFSSLTGLGESIRMSTMACMKMEWGCSTPLYTSQMKWNCGLAWLLVCMSAWPLEQRIDVI